jgi:hypothetical protein
MASRSLEQWGGEATCGGSWRKAAGRQWWWECRQASEKVCCEGKIEQEYGRLKKFVSEDEKNLLMFKWW